MILNGSAGQAIERGDAWLDGEVGADYKDQPLAQDWARAFKVVEEIGEAMGAMIAATGQNPRKPDLGLAHRQYQLAEMADAAVACLLGIQHFTKDLGQTEEYLAAALVKVNNRAREAGY